jgi:hypothetical protein
MASKPPVIYVPPVIQSKQDEPNSPKTGNKSPKNNNIAIMVLQIILLSLAGIFVLGLMFMLFTSDYSKDMFSDIKNYLKKITGRVTPLAAFGRRYSRRR